MKRNQPVAASSEPHVFDQTNGVVDLGTNEPEVDDAEAGRPDRRTTVGIAMLSTQRP